MTERILPGLTIWTDPGTGNPSIVPGVGIVQATGGGAYSIDVTHGQLTLAGQTVTLLKSSVLSVTHGTLTLAGQSVTLQKSSILSVTHGQFTLSGQSVTLLVNRVLGVTHGVLSLVGQDVTLLASRKLDVTHGELTLTGQSVDLTYTPLGAYSLDVTHGQLTLTGQSVTLLHAKVLDVTHGELTLTGQSVTLTYAECAHPCWTSAEILALTMNYDLEDTPFGTITVAEALRIMLAALAGKLSGADGTTVAIRDMMDSKNRIVATVDSSGNRTAITTLDGSV